jgi:hypothetical protein
MKPTILQPAGLAILFSFLAFSACKNKSSESKPGTVTESRESSKAKVSNSDTGISNTTPGKDLSTGSVSSIQKDFEFGPAISTISGTINTQMFYGAPGFGEHPKTDKKEFPFVINLVQGINVISHDKDENSTDQTKYNVTQIQLIYPDDINMASYKGKMVKLTGTFFGPETGHQHTEILMDVTKLDPQ